MITTAELNLTKPETLLCSVLSFMPSPLLQTPRTAESLGHDPVLPGHPYPSALTPVITSTLYINLSHTTYVITTLDAHILTILLTINFQSRNSSPYLCFYLLRSIFYIPIYWAIKGGYGSWPPFYKSWLKTIHIFWTPSYLNSQTTQASRCLLGYYGKFLDKNLELKLIIEHPATVDTSTTQLL